MIDFKNMNRILLRNFSESADFHDIVKTLLYKKIRRNNKNCPVYTEKPLNNVIPDIYLQTKEGDIIVYEIQKEITNEWLENKKKEYEDVDLIIVPLKKLSKDFNKLSKELDEYVV